MMQKINEEDEVEEKEKEVVDNKRKVDQILSHIV